MANQAKTTQRSVPYIQTRYRPLRRRRKSNGPRPLTVLLACCTVAAFLHFVTTVHPLYPNTSATTCQSLIRHTDYTKYAHLQVGSQEMQAVQYVDQLTAGQPAALVQVSDTSARHLLDVYIFGCTTQHTADPFLPATPQLTVLFKRLALVEGAATVTGANTLSISQLDSTLSPATRMLMQPAQQDVYREYTWQHGTFVQTIFPGLYPVSSRGEAEELQDEVNNGHPLPWSDPLFTSEQMARDVLHWSDRDLQETLHDNDGTTAHVLLTRQHPHIVVAITLSRLVQRNSSGLWFVTAAQTPGMTLDSTHLNRFTASPLYVAGTMSAPPGSADAILYDHTLTPVTILNAPTITVNNDGSYSGTILYSNNLPGQQGLLLIEQMPSEHSRADGQLLLSNVILN